MLTCAMLSKNESDGSVHHSGTWTFKFPSSLPNELLQPPHQTPGTAVFNLLGLSPSDVFRFAEEDSIRLAETEERDMGKGKKTK